MHLGAVEAHVAAVGGHTPVSRRQSVDLPDADGPTTASTSPAASSNDTPLRIGRPSGALKASCSTLIRPSGAGSWIAAGLARMTLQQQPQPIVAGAGRDEALPGADRLLDRRQRTAQKDRARDHAAAGQRAFSTR